MPRMLLGAGKRLADSSRAAQCAERAAAIATCKALGIDEAQIERGPPHLSRPAAPHGARRREGRRPVRQRQQGDQPDLDRAGAGGLSDAIHWILGGQAKTDDLDACAPHFGHVRAAYTIGEAGRLFAKLLAPHMPVTNCETLDDAVNHAAADAAGGRDRSALAGLRVVRPVPGLRGSGATRSEDLVEAL